MWQLDYEKSWVLKNSYFRTVVLEKTLESHLDCKEIQPVHPKGNQSWIFTGRIDAEAEAPILWSPDEKNWLIRKDPDAGKDGRQEKGTTEDEMVWWHHWLDGLSLSKLRELVMDREAWNPWGCKESDMTEWLNWTELEGLEEGGTVPAETLFHKTSYLGVQGLGALAWLLYEKVMTEIPTSYDNHEY